MQDSQPDVWLDEVVLLQPASGRARYLLHVERARCTECSTGTRTVSIWATAGGRGEVVAWCGHCFNATCEPLRLGERHRPRFRAVLLALSAGKATRRWTAVRPAVEDLERRGFL